MGRAKTVVQNHEMLFCHLILFDAKSNLNEVQIKTVFVTLEISTCYSWQLGKYQGYINRNLVTGL